jgi:hypothetical protein
MKRAGLGPPYGRGRETAKIIFTPASSELVSSAAPLAADFQGNVVEIRIDTPHDADAMPLRRASLRRRVPATR